MNLNVFDLINEIYELRTIAKHISCECRCEFDGRKCDSKQKLKNDSISMRVKIP